MCYVRVCFDFYFVCDAFMEMAVLALEDPTNALLFAFVKDIELGLGILNRFCLSSF